MTLKELKAKANRAVELSKELEALEAANPRGTYMRATLKNSNNGNEPLSVDMLAEVIDLGRQRLAETKREELESILGGPAVKTVKEV